MKLLLSVGSFAIYRKPPHTCSQMLQCHNYAIVFHTVVCPPQFLFISLGQYGMLGRDKMIVNLRSLPAGLQGAQATSNCYTHRFSIL